MHDPSKVETIVNRTRKDPIFYLSCKWDEEGSRDTPIGWKRERWKKVFFLYFSSPGHFFSPEKRARRFYRRVMRGLLKTIVPDVELFFFIFFFLLRLVAEQVLHHLMPLFFSAHLALPQTLAFALSHSLALLLSAQSSRSRSLHKALALCPQLAFCFSPEPRIENGRCRGRESAPPVVKARSVKDCWWGRHHCAFRSIRPPFFGVIENPDDAHVRGPLASVDHPTVQVSTTSARS